MTGAVQQRQASNIALASDLFERFSRAGVTEFVAHYDELFTEDFEFTPSIVGGLERCTYRGRDGWMDYARDLADVLEGFDFSEMSYQALGDAVVLVEGRTLSQGKTSGVPLDVEAGWVFELKDGRVARLCSFLSHAEAREEADRAAA